jgi:integrase
VRRSFYGRTRREVQEKLLEAAREAQQGYAPRNGRLTVGAYLQAWLRDAVMPTVRPSTYRSYELLVRVHITPHLGRTPLVKLSPLQVQTMLADLTAHGLSARSVHHVRAVLRTALNQAVRWELLQRNVASLVDGPKVPRHEVAAMSPREAQMLLEVVREDRLGALYALALLTGLRQGELLGLTWDDLDLTGGLVTVRHALQRVNGTLGHVEPKTSRSRREVALPPTAVTTLRAHRSRQLEERIWAGSRWNDTGFVFTTSIGTPLDGPNVTHRLQRILRSAGLPSMRFHDLRHACATLMLTQGVSARVVMEVLGHSQIGLTMDTYAHVIPALQRDAAERIESALAASSSNG